MCVDSSCQQNILFPSAFGVIVSKALLCLISVCWDGAFLLFYVYVLEVCLCFEPPPACGLAPPSYNQ